MPSQKILESKQQLVAELIEKIKASACGVLVDYKGITVEQDTKLRAQARSSEVDYFVVKNTMLKLALKEAGIEGLDDVLFGTTAIALAKEDVVAAPKVVGDFSSVLKIKKGFLEGEAVDEATITALSKIPSKETLVAQVLAGLNTPITKLAIVLNAIAEKQSA